MPQTSPRNRPSTWLRNCAPTAAALASTKRLIEELWASSVKKDVETALRHHMEARESAEAKEGIAAYLEKRSPEWE